MLPHHTGPAVSLGCARPQRGCKGQDCTQSRAVHSTQRRVGCEMGSKDTGLCGV